MVGEGGLHAELGLVHETADMLPAAAEYSILL